MSRQATAFVLGYHGCDQSVAERAIGGDTDLLQSNRDFDWLGPGAYFWESDPQRALEWAQWKASRGDYGTPAVVGAVIDLRNCLDLSSREDLALLRAAYDSFVRIRKASGLPMLENRSVPGDPNADRVLRFLDCAVLRHLHSILEDAPEQSPEPFDTVRGMFTEGGEVYPGSGFREKSHVQIAVRNPQCIKGIFRPRPYPAGP
ncbi:hypothetical protein J5J86_18450 [Aquabacter sp. L1I39]|uniref:hypothetical protein n=1 Tax=Aquabacter sp. L1I39 TaxID=2820278 RepID=UPI001ADA9203|nr:hypothetical protein [Aquabacter sp. L1I39]QTL02738.1 hypothetical protein J5J86_18450 [Aquabacter sp. L1I39]